MTPDAATSSSTTTTTLSRSPSSPLADGRRPPYDLLSSNNSPQLGFSHSRGYNRGKPVPSPLQHSRSPYSSLADRNHHSPRSPTFTSSSFNLEQPRSPRERLDALLATEEANHHPSATTTATRAQESTNKDIVDPAKDNPYAQIRAVSAPVLNSSVPSPPSSPTAMQPSKPQRTEPRPAPPRNASIDSAVSSIFSSASQTFRSNMSHPYKLSQDGPSSNPPDIASMIIAAGSPEAALQTLWKEKQSASAHNAQLWRLVEKQRALILGLNKDLERALKDKERYRKKAKEHMSQLQAHPAAVQKAADQSSQRDLSQSPADSEVQDTTSNRSNSAQDGGGSSGSAHQKISQAVPSRFQQGTLVEQASIHSLPLTSSTKDSLSSEPSPIGIHGQSSTFSNTLHLSQESTLLNELSSTPHNQINNSTFVDARGTGTTSEIPSNTQSGSQPPSVSVTQPTPIIGAGGFEKPAQPQRRPPPAPLNLANAKPISASLHEAKAGEDSDTDYEDILEIDEIPHYERGRRKTREEDDRIREAASLQEEESRSRSKKKSKSKSKSKSKPPILPQLDDGNRKDQSIMDASPLLGVASSLPSAPRITPAAGSINAILSPATSENSIATTQRSVLSPPLMSPGLPVSPRPSDRPLGSPNPRLPTQTISSPPMSPRGNGMPLSPRAPKQPLPLPPNTPLSFASPHLARAEAYAKTPSQPPLTAESLLKPQTLSAEDKGRLMLSEPSSPQLIDRSLMSDEYPRLLLPPNALPSIQVKISSSRLRPSRQSFLGTKPLDEDPVFLLAIYSRSDGKQLWRNEKTIAALPALDEKIRLFCKEFSGKLPDRGLFSGHAPAKIDARRMALSKYFDNLLDTPMDEMAALVVCEFFSSDAIGCEVNDAGSPVDAPIAAGTADGKGKVRKVGYLTKRGKNFGGWKARYFVLEGPELRYFESDGGAHLGTIKLQSAQIGKQSQQPSNQSRDDDPDNQYRHAFLILEPKRKDSSSLVRHVLCAESDDERDSWVEVLLQFVDQREDATKAPNEKLREKEVTATRATKATGDQRQKHRDNFEKEESFQGISYEDTVQAEAPQQGPSHRQQGPSSPTQSSFEKQRSNLPAISAPTNGAIIQDAGTWGNKSLNPTSIKNKKRSIFGFGGKIVPDAPHNQSHSDLIRPPPHHIIFGIPLMEAVEYSAPIGIDTQLPAVVYRCLEYLQAKHAEREEGIFRLSGSNNLIKALRDRFNNEGDVRLLEDQYYDIHAVASLLKLYLRELPASVLTRELHLEFLNVLNNSDIRRDEKISEFNRLVHRLPVVNRELLQALSSFLIDIVTNADTNKMTIRNVGIVFAPTLNIPAPLISFFLTDYADIYGYPRHRPEDETDSPIQEISVTAPPEDVDNIRSPRHQMFSDLPTPAYDRSFSQAMNQSNQGSARDPRAPYDTGFIPMQPTYDVPIYQQGHLGESYGSLNGAVQTGPANSKDAKARRRESSMLLNLNGISSGRAGQRTSIMPELREEQGYPNPKELRDKSG